MNLNINHYIENLKKIVAIKSPSGNIAGLNAMISFFTAQAETIPSLSYIQVFNQNAAPCLVISNANLYEELDVLLLADLDTALATPNGNNQFFIRENLAYGLGVLENKGNALLGILALQNLLAEKYNQQLKFAYILNSHSYNKRLDNSNLLQKFGKRSHFIISLANTNTGNALADSRYGLATYRVELEAPATHRISCNDEYSTILHAANFIKYIHTINKMTYNNFINFTILNQGDKDPNFIPHKMAMAVQIRFLETHFPRYFEKRFTSFQQGHMNNKVKIYCEQRLEQPPILSNPNTNILKKYIENSAKTLNMPITWATALGKSNALLAYSHNCALIEGIGVIGAVQPSGEYLDLQSVIPRTKLLMKTLATILKNKETNNYGRNHWEK
ncbi:Succinyl-diaminopimelate desuccinylase [Candidatus Hepatincola sp. Pdp]